MGDGKKVVWWGVPSVCGGGCGWLVDLACVQCGGLSPVAVSCGNEELARGAVIVPLATYHVAGWVAARLSTQGCVFGVTRNGRGGCAVHGV